MTGGLKRDLTFLQLISPAVAEKEPRSQTRCGGLLMLLCMPVAIVAYSVVWFHDWYITDRGALQVVEWGHFGEKIEGVPLDGKPFSAAIVMSPQTLTCLAESGCWYTVYGNERGQCPPKDALNAQARNSELLKRKLAADPDDAIWTKAPDLPTKRCAWVAKGEPLFGACLFAVTDPIDTLTVVWEAPKDKKSQKMGVALTTRNVSMAAAYERANARCPSGLNNPFAPCRWRTNGGGRGYVQKEMSMGLHFGEASLQVVHRDFSRMREDTGDCRLRDCPIKPQSTELVPIYSHTADEKLTADHLCAGAPAEEAANPSAVDAKKSANTIVYTQKCTSQENCRQLKIRPMPLAMHETREVVSPAAPFLAAIGGMAGLFLVGIKLVHMVFIRSPLGRLSLCAGAENEVLKAVEEIRVTVSGEPSGLEKNKV